MLFFRFLCLVAPFLLPTVVDAYGTGSCAGECGNFAGDCYCDSVCTSYEDCCGDFLQHCDTDGNPLPGEETDETDSYDGELEVVEPIGPPDCSENYMWGKGSNHCPSDNGLLLLNTEGVEPSDNDADIIWGIQEMDGSTIRLKIRNPFDSEMKTYVRYKEQIDFGPGAQLTCTEFDLEDCADQGSESIEISCFSGQEMQVTLVEVYFVDVSGSQEDIYGGAEIDACCHAEDPPSGSVAMYSFQVRCMCPWDEWEFEVFRRRLRGN